MHSFDGGSVPRTAGPGEPYWGELLPISHAPRTIALVSEMPLEVMTCLCRVNGGRKTVKVREVEFGTTPCRNVQTRAPYSGAFVFLAANPRGTTVTTSI